MDNICDLSDEEWSPKTPEVKVELKKRSPPAAVSLVITSSCLSTSPLMSPTSAALLPQQAIRSELRLLSSLHKRKVSLRLYECPLLLSATFEACGHNFSKLFVTGFKTSIGLEKSAIIRTNDIIELQIQTK